MKLIHDGFVKSITTCHGGERHSRTEDYQLKDCIKDEDLSTLAHFPSLEF